MATPFLSQIDIFSFNFAPKGYSLCNGQLLPINQNQALFSLLGTTYGGDGRTTFGLPDLRSRIPVSMGGSDGVVLGERGGEEAVTINLSTMPAHYHGLAGNTAAGTSNTPATNSVLAKSSGTSNTGQPFNVSIYASNIPTGIMDQHTIGYYGGGQAHTNLQPYLCLNMSIALQGIFPSQT
jgi:microcystin-dependent protein